MRVSVEWLGDFVEVPPIAELCDRLAAAGVPVDNVFDPAKAVQHVVVAEVEDVTAHPDGDRLRVCRVHDGTERYTVVCGAPNVAPGQRVAYARVGAILPGGMRITRRTLRGVDSEGMLCSRSELGLEPGKSPGLWELPTTFGLGRDVIAEAQISPVLALDITPNRPDLLSHMGVGREVAASTGKRPKAAKWRVTEKGPEVGSLARVLVEDAPSCRRYVARVVRGLKVGPSPDWLRERLESIGQRCINNVVDVTNYVLHELGQPLHAFDLSRLAVEAGLPTVRVRRAAEGERLRTLDGVDRLLTNEDLVVADANRPIALAGVMGGADSEVTPSTVSVLIESAYFDSTRVRGASKRHGLRSEASLRFERGADPGIAVRAVDRCAQLLAEVAEGEVAKGLLEVSQKGELHREIPLRLERVGKILGTPFGTEAVVQLLEPLEIRCVARTEGALVFETPSFRPDITREIDLIEELARRHGYDRIAERIPETAGDYTYQPIPRRPSDVARTALLAAGCSEVVTYGMGSPGRMETYAPRDGTALRLLNPVGEELSALRTTLLPGLLQCVVHNIRHGHRDLKLFEVGTVFGARTPDMAADERDRDLPFEDVRLGCVMTGGRWGGRWYERGEQVDFADLAGVLESLVDAMGLGVPWQVRPATSLGYNPHCSAELWAGELRVGHAGRLDSTTQERWDLQQPVYAAELSLSALAQVPAATLKHRPLPKYPGTRRDVAVVAPRRLAAEHIRQFLLAHAGGELGRDVVERVWLFDVYAGKPIAADHVSLAFAIEYRSAERTLTDDEVGAAFQKLLPQLTAKFPVEVRH